MEKFSAMPVAQDALFESHYKEMGKSFKALMESNPSPDVGTILESFDTTPYALDEKIVKGKSDISYVFKDEAGDRYRIQFLAAPKFGKGVAKVYIGKGKGGRLFVDKIDRFTNPKAMIATVINFFTEHLLTPEGMGLRGFIVDLSGAASIRSIPILKKVIKSALISKIKVADDTFQPQEGRKYLWITKSTLKPADVFNGPGSEGAPWLQGKEKAGDQSTDKKGDAAGVKSAKFDPMVSVQALIDQVLPTLKKKFKDITLTPSLNNQMKWVSVTANVDGQPVTNFMFEYKRIKSNGADMEPKYVVSEITEYVTKRMAQIEDAQKRAKEESERAMNLKKDPAFYLKQQQAAIEGEINLKVKGYNFKLEFTSSGKLVKARVLENGVTPVDYIEFTAPNSKEDDEEMRDFAVSQIMKILRRVGYTKGRKPGLVLNQPVKVTNFSRYSRGFKTEGDLGFGILTSAEETFGNVLMSKNNVNHKVDWVDIEPQSGAADGGQTKSKTQTATGKVAKTLDTNAKKMIDLGMKDVKSLVDGRVEFKHPEFGDLTATFSNGLISEIMGSGGIDKIAPDAANLFAENLKKPAMLYMGNAVPSPVRAKVIEKALATRVGVLKQRVSSVVILPPSITVKQGGVTYEMKARTQSGDNGAMVVTLNPINGGTSVVGDTTINGKTEHIQRPLGGLVIPVEASIEEFLKFRDIVNELEKEVTPPTSAKQIVRAKIKDRHGYYINVSYNPNINRVFVKDDNGTSYAASRVMFMHPNKGTAELNSMFTDAVLSGGPRNSIELVKVLKTVTRLPEWETA